MALRGNLASEVVTTVKASGPRRQTIKLLFVRIVVAVCILRYHMLPLASKVKLFCLKISSHVYQASGYAITKDRTEIFCTETSGTKLNDLKP
jgi:hypothetical protein